MTQIELAQAVGIDRTVLSRIEGGSRALDSVLLARIADVVGQRVNWFLEDRTTVHGLFFRESQSPGDSLRRRAVGELEQFVSDCLFLQGLGL
ncbi:MAG: hypothetical protein A2W26_07990 [Acidobacteria bacterium RBG_16_64_8]|nr:MAG: hypothetical protein A2W26_07990 [Acidobacteria bacterium RBG_16_64_8]